MPVAAMPLQRKKSLPDVAQPIQLTATAPLSREEVSILSSMRREEIRRQIDESERLRANPLLYLVSPQVKVSILRVSLRPDRRNLSMLTMARGVNSRWLFKNKREYETALGRVLRFISGRVLRLGLVRKNITHEKRNDSIIGSRAVLEISIRLIQFRSVAMESKLSLVHGSQCDRTMMKIEIFEIKSKITET